MSTHVLYHANCLDGYASHYVAWRHFGNEADYHPVSYNKPFPISIPLDGSANVFILDFSYSRQLLLDIKSRLASLTVLDHHKTAQADLEGLDFAIFDMNKSGCGLTWDYFFPEAPMPKALKHTQDRDLWRFILAGTKAFCAAAYVFLGDDVYNWQDACTKESFFNEVMDSGNTLLVAQRQQIASIVKDVRHVEYAGHHSAVVCTNHLVSEVGDSLLTTDGVELAILISMQTDGLYKLSFRSKPGVDVSVLAKQLGGGGHATAAGATVGHHFVKLLLQGQQW